MSTQLDFTLGLWKETVFGTAVTPQRFYESEAKMKYDIKRADSKGLRPTKGVQRLNRTSVVHYEGSGDVSLDVPTRGFGALLEAVLGSVTNQKVLGSSPDFYQQVHTLSKTDPVYSYTVQECLPFLGGGAAQPHTFTGVVFEGMDLEAKEGGFLTAKFGMSPRKLDTSIAATAASYPADDSLFTFVHGAIILGGTLVPPTVSAVAASTGTVATNIADFSLSLKRGLDSGGFNLGGAGYRSRKRSLGAQDITGKITAEYTDNTLRDAYLNQTPLSLLLTFEHNVAVSGALKPMLQVALPAILLDGEVPASDGGNVIKQSIPFKLFDNGAAAEPIWIVYRTLDTAV